MTPKIIGRQSESDSIKMCLSSGRNVLLEGPVGVGKTFLAMKVLEELGRKNFRIDGDSRYTEQKLAGGFDPAALLKSGYSEKSFVSGPLTEAMRKGAVLFINELNRLPEGVQNILLPAIDEGIILIPKLGEIKAKKGFQVIATQNPKEFVATSHLSEAILDRFELVRLGYQSEDEETQILRDIESSKELGINAIRAIVRIVRQTRVHPKVRRGASIRAAISICEIAARWLEGGLDLGEAILRAALISLPTRMEVDSDDSPARLIEEIVRNALAHTSEKKN